MSNNCLNLNPGPAASSALAIYLDPSYLVEKVPMPITHSFIYSL